MYIANIIFDAILQSKIFYKMKNKKRKEKISKINLRN